MRVTLGLAVQRRNLFHQLPGLGHTLTFGHLDSHQESRPRTFIIQLQEAAIKHVGEG